MDIAAVYHTGFDFESYLEKLGDDGLKFASRYEKVQLTDNLIRLLQELDQPLKILALSEPWCPDCVLHVPLLARMATVSNCVQLMVFSRDQQEDLAAYLSQNGKKIIPVALFMDQDFHEIGRWYERPAVVQSLIQTPDEDVKQEIKRKYVQGHYLADAMVEIEQILSKWVADRA